MIERRYSPRHPASLHAQIETASGRFTIALTQDVSTTGLLVHSHQQIEGRVTIYVLLDGVQYMMAGTVVRQEPLAHGETSLWRAKAAVAIDPAEPDAARIAAALVAREASATLAGG